MARFEIKNYNSKGELIHSDIVTACKQPKSWVLRTYGKYETNEYYYVRKKNKYGVVWVIGVPDADPWYMPTYQVCTDPHKATSKLDVMYLTGKVVIKKIA